jgi:probable rRNA maturation factor
MTNGREKKVSLEIFNYFKEKIEKKEKDRLKRFLKEVLKVKGFSSSKYDISIVLIDDEKMIELNRKYRNINSTTDVLSFNLGKDPRGKIIGEIYISIPTVEKENIEKYKALIDEIAFLSLHGLLHILGYDHENMKDREEMEKETQKLIKYWVHL